MQSDLVVDNAPEVSRSTYQYAGPKVLAKMIIKAIPSDYITAVQNLKQNSVVLAKIDALQNHDTSSVESKFGEDWVPELPKLKKALTAEWRARFKGLSSESTPSMMGAEGTALQPCWDCGENGHLRGDPSCRQQGACAGSTCPKFLKELKGCWQGCRWQWRRQQSWHEAQEWWLQRVPLLQAHWHLQVR
jgi:hypothetical protein